MAGAIDLFSGTGSISGSNLFNVDKSPLNQFFNSLDDTGQRDTFLDTLETFIEGVIDKVVEFFEALTGLNIDEGPIAFFVSVFQRLEEITGLNWDEGPIAFLVSIVDAVVSAIETLTGLNINEGPIAFFDSLWAALESATGLNWDSGPIAFLVSVADAIISTIETLTGLNINEGPIAFFDSLWAALESATGLNWDSGPVEFLVSVVEGVVSAIEALTGTNIDEGPEKFLLSLLVSLESATGWDWSHGPVVFLQSVLDVTVASFENLTGLNINEGPIKFFESLFTALESATGLDWTHGPIPFIESVGDAVISAIEYLTGLNINAGPEAFIESLFYELINGPGEALGNMIEALEATGQGLAEKIGRAVIQAIEGIPFVGGAIADVLEGLLNGLVAWVRGGNQSGSNLLNDGGAENAKFWEAVYPANHPTVALRGTRKQPEVTRDATVKRSAGASLRVTSGGANPQSFYWTVNDLGDVVPISTTDGDWFYAECFVFVPASNVGSAAVTLVAEFRNSTNINTITTSTVTVGVVKSSGLTDPWQKVSGTFNVPTGYDRISFGFLLGANSTTSGDRFYVDDMLVREVTGTQNTLQGIHKAIRGGDGTSLVSLSTVGFALGGLTNLAQGSSQAGSNLLVDPQASYPSLWIATGLTTSTGIGTYKSASRSLQITSAGSTARSFDWTINDTGATAPIVAQPGDIFYCECYVLSPPGNGAATITLHGKAKNSATGATLTLTPQLTASPIASGPWTKISGQYTVPSSGYDQFIAGITLASGATTTGNRFYIDDMVVREITGTQNLANSTYDGLNGTAGSTAVQPYEIYNVAAAVKATAAQGVANAAVADGKAAVAQAASDNLQSINSTLLTKGANICTNPGFENTNFFIPAAAVSGAIPASYSTDVARTGTRSSKHVRGFIGAPYGDGSPRSVHGLVGDSVAGYFTWCQPGDMFAVEFYVYGKATNVQTTGGTNGIGLFFNVIDPTGATVGNPAVYATASTALNGKWTKVSGVITIPATGVQFGPYLQVTDTVPLSDIYYFDDVSVYRVTEALAADEKAVAAQTASDILASITETLAARGANICTNPGFENTNFFIGQGSASYSTDVARTGIRSSKHQRNGSYGNSSTHKLVGDANGNSFTRCAPGDTFTVEFYVYGKATNVQTTGGTNGIGLIFNVINTAGTNVGNPAVYATASTALNGVWTKVSGTVTIPANGVQFEPYLQVADTVPLFEVYYFDDVSIFRTTEATVASVAAAVAKTQADLGVANAATADGKAVTADGKAVTAQTAAATAQTQANLGVTNAATADAKAVVAQNIIDSKMRAGKNLATNPECSDADAWKTASQWTPSVSTDEKRSGTTSVKLVISGAAYPSIGFLRTTAGGSDATGIAVRPGDKFYMECWARAKASNVSVGKTWGIQAWSYDSTGAVTYSFLNNLVTLSSTTWTKITHTFTIPAGRDRFYASFTGSNGNTVGDTYYIDDLILLDVTDSQDVIDSIVQGVAGGTATGYTLANVKSNVAAVNSTANTGIANAATAQTQANLGVTNAATANTNLQTTWNELADGLDGTPEGTFSTGRTPASVRTRGATVRASAATGVANAAIADGKAATAQTRADLGVTNAATADGKAVTADGKAVTAQGFANNALRLGANILPNGGFENTNFYIGNGVYDTTVKLSGSYSARLTGSGVRVNLTTGFLSSDTFVNSVPCRPSATFYVEGWVYGDPANTGGGSLYIYVDDYNSAGVLQPQQASAALPAAVGLRGVWTKMSATITLSSSAASVYIFTYQSGQPAGDKYYYDNFVAYEVTEAKLADSKAATATANAATADGKAVTVSTNLQTTWNELADGLDGTPEGTFSTGRTPANIRTRGATVRASAATGVANAATADGKAVTAQTNNQAVVDAVYQAYAGGTSTGNAISTVKTNVLAVKTQADLGVTNAATADGKAVTADGKAVAINQALYNANTPAATVPQAKITNLSSDLTADRSNLVNSFSGTTAATGQTPADVLAAGQNFFTKAVVDLIPDTRVPVIPAGHISSAPANLLIAGSFANAASLASGMTGWAWDGTQDHTGVAGSGSARATANGTNRTLSSKYIAVVPTTTNAAGDSLVGDTISVEGWVKWTGVTASGDAFKINLLTYSGTTNVSTISIGKITSPAATGGWTKISGSYVVPAGVNNVALQIQVMSSVTAGSVYWDDLSLAKTGNIDGLLVSGLQTGNATIVDDLQGAVDGVVIGLSGLNSDFYSTTDLAEKATSTKNSIAENAAAIAALQVGSSNSSNGGTYAVVNFADRAPFATLGSDFSQTYSLGSSATLGLVPGYYGTGPSVAAWSGSPESRSCVVVYNAAQTITNYQSITMTPVGTPSYDDRGAKASSYIFGRMNAAGTSYVYARLTYNTAELGCVVSGTPTVWATATGFTFSAATNYSLICGNASGERVFQLLAGSTPVQFLVSGVPQAQYTETTPTSALGTLNRYTGFGGICAVGQGRRVGTTYLAAPAALSAFSMADNTPATYIGSGFVGVNTSVDTASLTSGTARFDNNWYVLESITGDMQYFAADNKLVVSIEGWYAVEIAQRINGGSFGVGSGGIARAALFKNGALEKIGGPSSTGGAGALTSISMGPFGGSFVVYLKKDEYLQPGYSYYGNAAGTNFLIGDANGEQTWWSVSLLNRSLN